MLCSCLLLVMFLSIKKVLVYVPENAEGIQKKVLLI